MEYASSVLVVFIEDGFSMDAIRDGIIKDLIYSTICAL